MLEAIVLHNMAIPNRKYLLKQNFPNNKDHCAHQETIHNRKKSMLCIFPVPCAELYSL